MSFARYPTYKDSGVEWLGQVPEHWEIVQFKQFVDIQNGSDHKHVEQADGYPVLGSGGVFTYASDFLYDGESVLLGRKGTIDKPLHITGRFWTVDTMYWTKINPAASGRFTYYSALTIPFDYYSTNTALPSMTKGALSSHSVARPPLPEQTQIAAFLDRETAKIDGLVAEQRRLMALLKEKRQTVISHAVTRGLDPDVPMKPSGIEWLGDVPAHWDVKPVKAVCKLFGRIGYRGYTTADIVDEGEGAITLSPSNMADGVVSVDKSTYISWDKYSESPEIMLQPGDIVMVKTGSTFGKVAYVSEVKHPTTINPQLVLFKNTTCVSRFLFFIFCSGHVKAFIDVNNTGSSIPTMTQESIGNFGFALPPKQEQEAVIHFVDMALAKLDTLTTEAQRAIDLLQERRTALISAAVTGQIDVRDTAGSL